MTLSNVSRFGKGPSRIRYEIEQFQRLGLYSSFITLEVVFIVEGHIECLQVG